MIPYGTIRQRQPQQIPSGLWLFPDDRWWRAALSVRLNTTASVLQSFREKTRASFVENEKEIFTHNCSQQRNLVYKIRTDVAMWINPVMVSITQHAPALPSWPVPINKVASWASHYRAAKMCEIEKFHLICESRVLKDQSVFFGGNKIRMLSPPPPPCTYITWR